MAIEFNDSTGLSAEDTAVIRLRIASLFKAAFKTNDDTPELNTEPETPAGQLVDGLAALVASKDGEIMRIANGFNPKTAVGIQQDALAAIYFLERQVAQPTYVTCRCYGLMGTVIPYGAIVQDANGYTFYNTGVGEIASDGFVDCVFRCSQYGVIEVGKDTIKKIITVVPGWDRVKNIVAGTTGREMENQIEFEQRRIDSVAKNSHGLAESVEGTIGNIQGVIACRIEQNRSNTPIEVCGVTIPGHSVYLSVYGGEDKNIALGMHLKLDAGCGTAGNTKVTIEDPTNKTPQTYYFQKAVAKKVFVKTVIQRTSTTPANIEEIVKKAVLQNFNGQTNDYPRVKMGSTLFASRFYQSLFNADVSNVISVEVRSESEEAYGDKTNISLDVMPTLASDDIEVNILEE